MRIPRRELQAAVDFACQVTTPTQNKIQLVLLDNLLIFRAASDIGFAEWPINIEDPPEDFTTLLDATKLSKLVKTLQRDEITLTVARNQLKLTDGDFKASFNIDATEIAWPYQHAREWGRIRGNLTVFDLLDNIISVDEDPPGHVVQLDDDKTLYCLDRTQSCGKKLEDESFTPEDVEILLPRKSWALLKSFTAWTSEVRVYQNASFYVFMDNTESHGILGLRKLALEDFPSWDAIEDAVHELPECAIFDIDKSEAIGELKKMLALSTEGDIAHATLQGTRLKFILEERVRAGSFILSVERIDAETEREIEFDVSIQRLFNHITACPPDESGNVKIHIYDRTDTKVLCVDGDEYTSYLMGVIPNVDTEARQGSGDHPADSNPGEGSGGPSDQAGNA